MLDEGIYKNTFQNKQLLEKSINCVCIYCKNKMNFNDIKGWIKDDNDNTAICPHCGVDAIIPLIIDGKQIDNKTINYLYTTHFENK